MHSGADRAVAVDSNLQYVKAIGASAQRNECFVETVESDAGEFLQAASVGGFDCILDPPAGAFDDTPAAVTAWHESALGILSPRRNRSYVLPVLPIFMQPISRRS